MAKKKRWYRLDREPDYIMRLLSQKATSIYRKCRGKETGVDNPFSRGAKMSIIKKLTSFKNSETFVVIIKVIKLLWRLFRKSNINVLTDNDEPRDPQTGSPEFRGIPVRIYPI